MRLLGLDIGTNSVGSAWIDTEKKLIQLGDSVFPAGVEESDRKRGAPKNQARRTSRQRRRNVDRRADRKHHIRRFLSEKGWMPQGNSEQQNWLGMNPWILRKEGLERELSPYEFGRIILHLAQRRGAFGFDEDEIASSENADQESEEIVSEDTSEEKGEKSKDKEQKIK
jgi:CRISPR-associated endonuclease Csn1